MGGAIVGSLLGAGAANADSAMYRVGTDIRMGEYSYRLTDSFGSYYLCSNTRCEVGDGIIEVEPLFGSGATGYLSITSDVKYVKATNLVLTPL